MKRRTCVQCKRGKLSSNLPECVKCIQEDKPGNRFPNFEVSDEEIARLAGSVQ